MLSCCVYVENLSPSNFRAAIYFIWHLYSRWLVPCGCRHKKILFAVCLLLCISLQQLSVLILFFFLLTVVCGFNSLVSDPCAFAANVTTAVHWQGKFHWCHGGEDESSGFGLVLFCDCTQGW